MASASTKLPANEIAVIKLIQRVRLAPVIPTAWLPISYVMAHVEIESGFNPTIPAADYAVTGSVGLMQPETVTATETLQRYATSIGISGLPIKSDMTDPLSNLTVGMLYLWTCRQYLLPIFGSPPPLLYSHIAMAYNEGPGAAGRGEADDAYYYRWLSAQQRFAFLDAPAPTVA